jgi:hypothetical protein
MPPDKEMLRLDPESEACFERMTAIIAEEIEVRIAAGNSETSPENIQLWAQLAADELLHAFVVRPRTADNPLYKFVDPEA